MTDQVRDVELRLPAESAYVAVLRMTASGLAARQDFTLDDIEDLRIAVGEACALVLDDVSPSTDLLSRFELGAGSIRIEVSGHSEAGHPIDETSFGWQVLSALVEDLSSRIEGDRRSITFSVTSGIHG